MVRKLILGVSCMAVPFTMGQAGVLVSQPPPAGGGISRASQYWQDPGPDGNDLDSDAVCWQDFTLTQDATITHLEWWGSGACELGFQIEFWPQDPGTIAYQPLGVFDIYGGSNVHPVAAFQVSLAQCTPTPAGGGLYHYSLDLPTPVALAANDAANPRWFVDIVAWTAQPFANWNWAQGQGGSNRSFWWVRGAHMFYSLGDGRALAIAGDVACPADWDGSGGPPNSGDFLAYLNDWAAQEPAADLAPLGGDGVWDSSDFLAFLNLFAGGC